MKKIVQYLIITVLSGVSLSSLYAATIQEALDASNRKEYAISFMLSKQLCDERVGRACNLLATHYEHAKGVAKDTTKAMALYTQACELEEARGCNNLGKMYASEENFKDTSKSNTFYQKAALLYEKQCNSGTDAVACNNLGISYANGTGVPKDQTKASELFKKGCDGGNAIACSLLGHSYANGKGVSKDEAKANELYKKGCDGGDAIACNNLGASYTNGTGVSKDYAKASELFKKGCDGGEKLSCDNLKNLQDKGYASASSSTKAPSSESKESQTKVVTASEIVGIDDLESFPSDYMKKNVGVICFNGSVRETAKKSANDALQMWDQMHKKEKPSDKQVEELYYGKTAYDIQALCFLSDKKNYKPINPFKIRVYTHSKEAAKAVAKGGNTKLVYIGKMSKGSTKMTMNEFEFEVLGAQENQ